MGASRIVGLALIALGIVLFVVVTTDLGGEVVVAVVGVGFLVAYAATRTYGLLIPGAILTGLGTGILVESYGGPQEAVVLGLGIGFLMIAVVDTLVHRVRARQHPERRARGGWWWPLIPGGILSVTGASTMAGVEHLGRYAAPVVLIVIGLVLLLGRSSSTDRDDAAAETPSER